MPLVLQYIARTDVPVDVEGLLPSTVRDKPLADVERSEVFHGNRKVPLAELFALSGDPSDGRIEISGDLSGVHRLGAGMDGGEIHVHGSAGRHLGARMTAGSIDIEGDAGDFAGADMRAGFIRVRGRAGHSLGAASQGNPRGMTGGTILVHGPVGDEACRGMRRGLVAVGGTGDSPGYGLLAGTLLVFGPCGRRPGAEMRRGTIGLFGPRPAAFLPSFRYACRYQPVFLSLLLAELRRLGYPLPEGLGRPSVDLYHGDLLSLGRGELVVAAEAPSPSGA